VDFSGFARAAGYRDCHTFDDPGSFASRIGTLLHQPGPIFITMKVVPGTPPKLDYEYMHGARVRQEFKAALASTA
jgi:hypothetical protein